MAEKLETYRILRTITYEYVVEAPSVEAAEEMARNDPLEDMSGLWEKIEDEIFPDPTEDDMLGLDGEGVF